MTIWQLARRRGKPSAPMRNGRRCVHNQDCPMPRSFQISAMSFWRHCRLLRFVSCTAVLLLLAVPAIAASIAGPKLDRIEHLITAEMSRQNIPGMSIAIAAGDSTWSNGYGLSDLENFVPAKASTVYRLA